TRENVVTSAGQKVVWDKRTSGNEIHSLDTLILSRGPRSIPDHTPKGLHSRLRRAGKTHLLRWTARKQSCFIPKGALHISGGSASGPADDEEHFRLCVSSGILG